MDKERIRLIVQNLESLVNCLKQELDNPIKDSTYEEIKNFISDYDEVFYEDDDYPNWKIWNQLNQKTYSNLTKDCKL